MPERIQRPNKVTLQWSADPKRKHDQTEKPIYCLDSLQNVAAEMDYKLSQNVQNTTWSHKLYRENHKNLQNVIDWGRKNLRWSKDAKRYFSRLCTVIVTIHNCYKTQKVNKKLETLIHPVRIYFQDIGMEFDIEKYAMQVMKIVKRHLTEKMEIPNQDKIRTLGEKIT